MDFYEILLSIMHEKSLNIPDVARATGLSDSTIRSIISRKTKNITLEVAFKMSKGLNVSLERLNGEQNKKIINEQLSNNETLLLSNYNKLNDLGKVEANKRVSELTEISIYRDEEQHIGKAAHNDFAYDEEQQKLMQEDLDEL